MNIKREIELINAARERAEKKYNQLLGQREAAIKRLNELGFDDVDSAKEYVEKMSKELEEMKAELERDIAEFRNIYSEFL